MLRILYIVMRAGGNSIITKDPPLLRHEQTHGLNSESGKKGKLRSDKRAQTHGVELESRRNAN
jgi:hypothetical protein